MELNTFQSNGYPKLILTQGELCRGGNQEPIFGLYRNLREALPRQGWRPRGNHEFRLWSHRDVADVICEISHEQGQEFSALSTRLFLYPVYQRAQDSGGLPFHAALIERNGIGVLLVAPADTGKSTCCLRLTAPWFALCDEETLIVRNKQKRYLAHPLPTWSDCRKERPKLTWNVQRYIPLSAIFFLEQAKSDEVVPIGQGQAEIFITLSTMYMWRRAWIIVEQDKKASLTKKVLENASELAKAVPAFILRVSLSGRFWEEMEKVL